MELRRGRVGIGLELVASGREQLLEAIHVQLARLDVEPIRAPLGLEPPVASERLAQRRHLVVEHLLRRRRRRLTPELLHEPLARDELVGPQKQQGEEGTLPSCAYLKREAAVPNDLKRAKQAKVQTSPP